MTVIAAYHYDPKFQAYTHKSAVEGEPRANGETVYTLPVWSTAVAPPPIATGEAAVFLERTRSWVVVSDHRGETWLDWAGRPSVIERLGDPAHWDMRPVTKQREAG